jgi:hypothetical protein
MENGKGKDGDYGQKEGTEGRRLHANRVQAVRVLAEWDGVLQRAP